MPSSALALEEKLHIVQSPRLHADYSLVKMTEFFLPRIDLTSLPSKLMSPKYMQTPIQLKPNTTLQLQNHCYWPRTCDEKLSSAGRLL